MSSRSRHPHGGKLPQVSPMPQQPSSVSTRTRRLCRVETVPNGATIGFSSGAATRATRSLAMTGSLIPLRVPTPSEKSLQGSRRAPGRNSSLDRQKEQEHGNRRDHGGRHDRTPIDRVVPEVLIEAERERLELGLRQE